MQIIKPLARFFLERRKVYPMNVSGRPGNTRKHTFVHRLSMETQAVWKRARSWRVHGEYGDYPLSGCVDGGAEGHLVAKSVSSQLEVCPRIVH
jgi:hypothetical protein